MELIRSNLHGVEISVWRGNFKLDSELGSDENTFQIIAPAESNKVQFEDRIYIPNTEWGGIVKDIQQNTAEGELTINCETWRGILKSKIITPPAGQDYKIVSGDVTEILYQLIERKVHNFKVIRKPTASVTNFKFDRYCTLLDGANKLLKSVGYKMNLAYRQKKQQGGYVEIDVVPIQTIEDKEYSQEGGINFISRENRMGYNRLICLGTGELKDRLRVDLYLQDGEITQSGNPNLQWKEAVYETAISDRDELIEAGKEELRSISNYKQFEMFTHDESLNIGDCVAGTDKLTGIRVVQPITTKILEMDEKSYMITYNVKGD